MTRTSGTFPASSLALPRGSPGGFTLLELIVVLALLGLATALVAPAGMRMIDSWRRSTDVDAALNSLAALSVAAQRQGRSFMLEAGPVPLADLEGMPEGWMVVLDTPLHIQANGACADTQGELRATDGYVQRFDLHAPFCRTQRAGEP